ncbi:MAG: PLP-dependent transferase [Myxococcus sp.]|nr:PLP-dependent transferase [Myxococcus sp.]
MSATLTPPPGFATQLLSVLPTLLAPGALPDDWDTEATTYDLNRFRSEADFVQRFFEVVAALANGGPVEPSTVRAQLASCGLPSDYARLGQPLSTVVELLLQSQSGARRALSFASRTKPYLSIVEAYATPSRAVRLFTPGAFALSSQKKAALRASSVELHEGHRGLLPPATGNALTVFVAEDAALLSNRAGLVADAVVIPVEGGGVTLLENDAIDPHALQLVRKRTAGALLAIDARDALCRAAGLPVPARAEATHAACEALLRGLFPQLRTSAIFHTGLAAEAAVFSAAARLLNAKRPVKLLYAENGYGGTCQLIAELLERDGVVEPVPLPVLSRDGRGTTLVERMVSTIEGLDGAPAVLFLETPTNPELQVHDFPRLFAALRAYQDQHGLQLPVLADTTLAPLFPLLAQPYAQGWPCVIIKSGSKYFTRGKATLGVAFASEHPLGRAIIDHAIAYGRDADTAAKPTQLFALAEGLKDLPQRMARIATNTAQLAAGLRAALEQHGHQLLLYTIDEADLARGLASGVLSFYLPAAPTTHADLVDEFVDELLAKAPTLVKNRVSYGQSTGGGRPDYFYVINPQESTQGALSAEVKAAQKRDNVQICRISVPEHADVPGLLRVIEAFLARKYG